MVLLYSFPCALLALYWLAWFHPNLALWGAFVAGYFWVRRH